tara:strand:+ start:286 stop:990 length:705 start_codon:yes stop_codon:yes gene_type:complete
MTKQSKTSSASDSVCKWCEKGFRSDRTLAAHMCPRKRRWADKEMTHVRLGYRVFQMFYELNTAQSKPKSMEDFIRSQYYEGFTKFGRSCIRNEYLQPEKFAEWLIKNGKKLADWSKDAVYDEWLLQYIKKEPGMKALERSIMHFATWSEEHTCSWQDYFNEVSPARFVHDVRSGKVSPWVIYLSETGGEVLTRLADEQVKMIQDIIDANFWMKIFTKHPAEVTDIKNAVEIANI